MNTACPLGISFIFSFYIFIINLFVYNNHTLSTDSSIVNDFFIISLELSSAALLFCYKKQATTNPVIARKSSTYSFFITFGSVQLPL